MQVNIHHLELFYFVARFEGITKAVRQMPYGIQQPAVSGQILQLEESLGLTLFQRRPFKLTRAGEELYAFIAPFFSNLPRVVSGIRGEEGQHLRLAASASVLSGHLPALLDDMRAENPGIRLTLREVGPADAEELVLRQEADVAITILQGTHATGIKSTPLVQIPMVLLHKGKGKNLESLAAAAADGQIGAPLIAPPIHEPLRKQFHAELGRRGLRWEPQVEVQTIELVEVYAAQGFGYGLSPDIPRRQLPDGITKIPLDGFPPLHVGLLHMGKLKPVAERFAEEATRRAQNLG